MIWWVLILYSLGLALLLAEFFVPGGILGIIGGALMVASAVLGAQNFPEYAFFLVTAQLLGAIVVIVVGILMLPRIPTLQRMVLTDNLTHGEQGWVSDKSDYSLMDREGEVYTMLRPAGVVMIGGERVNAVSNGDFIEPGAKVKVIEVHGNRVVVERVDNE
ncbi:MAG: NfeD family protein [Candidatus Hydrogenedentota bacterium]